MRISAESVFYEHLLCISILLCTFIWKELEKQRMETITLRQARLEDAQAILDIYAPYIRNTNITFEYEVPTLPEFRKRMEEIMEGYPYLICEINGAAAGYAYAHRYKERAAYQWDAELSVYLDERYARRGIGRAFYTALMEILKEQNVRNVYGMDQTNAVLADAQEAIANFQEVSENVNELVNTGSLAVGQTMEKIDQMDIERLNEAIADLNRVIEPLAEFFGRFQ